MRGKETMANGLKRYGLCVPLALFLTAGCFQTDDGHTAGARNAEDTVTLPPLPEPPPEGPDFHPDGAGWALVWADEFNGDRLDTSKWRPEISCWGGGNDEKQCYTDRPENVQVVNGVLRLIARAEPFLGRKYPTEWRDFDSVQEQPYTSGKVRSRGLANWTYGRFEVRAKVPAGQGAWPAVWMMPEGTHYGGWPLSGEIDILEAINIGASCIDCIGDVGENRTLSALHFGAPSPGNEAEDTRVTLPDGALPSDGYHVWAAEWGAGLIRFFLDGQEHWRATADDWTSARPLAEGNPNAPFDKPFYIMANLAIGGQWPEASNDGGIAPDTLPAQFLIDWIRVYQCTEDPAAGRACMD